MTDEELQRFCDQDVRLKIGDRILQGKLICGVEAQLALSIPYAIKTLRRNPSLETYDTHFDGIPYAEAVESAELVDEPVGEEIEDEVQDLQTPG
jgi:hypothetical protein